MQSLEQLTEAVIKFRNDRNWEQFHTAKDCAIGLTVEASEAAELFLYKTDEEIEKAGKKWKEDLGDELSDVMYWLLITAHRYDIDLSKAVIAKLEKTAKKYPIEKSFGVSGMIGE